MLFSVRACLVFVARTERKISLLPSMAIHISVTTCDACAADHVVRFTRPSPSVFTYCKRSKTGAGEGLGTRLRITPCTVSTHTYILVLLPYTMAQISYCMAARASRQILALRDVKARGPEEVVQVYGFCIRTLRLPVISVMIIGVMRLSYNERAVPDGRFRHHLFQAVFMRTTYPSRYVYFRW